jgi:phosphoglycolate phosphatase-like HAD superfamily hydrolase
MTQAFWELFAVENAFRGIPLPGRTDSWILSDAAAAHGIPLDSPELARFPEVYLRRLALELDKPGTGRNGVMPGVRRLLDTLAARDDVFLALLTGNYETAARLKLERFDLWRYFACGAFGDAAPDRNGLFAKAIARVTACGARSIAVATGNYSVDELRASGADVVFEDLSDTDAVLAAMRGS